MSGILLEGIVSRLIFQHPIWHAKVKSGKQPQALFLKSWEFGNAEVGNWVTHIKIDSATPSIRTLNLEPYPKHTYSGTYLPIIVLYAATSCCQIPATWYSPFLFLKHLTTNLKLHETSQLRE